MNRIGKVSLDEVIISPVFFSMLLFFMVISVRYRQAFRAAEQSAFFPTTLLQTENDLI